MLSNIKTIALNGLAGSLVNVQVDMSSGLPNWDIVGLPDTTVRESKERIKVAIKNSNIKLKSKKVIVNLSPADSRKEGAYFDLPIAMGILTAAGCINKNSKNLNMDKTIFIGELSLDGSIKRVNGVLPICIETMRLGINTIVIPKENEEEASLIEGITIYPVDNLIELINFINERSFVKMVENKKYINNLTSTYDIDFKDVKGQDNAKRALEIAAAGRHNFMILGNPGTRKNNVSK